MGLMLGCKMKKKLQICPYEEIKREEASIDRTKASLQVIEEKNRCLEKILSYGEPQKLYAVEESYKDGFLWEEEAHLEVPPLLKELEQRKTKRRRQNCLYKAESCDDVLKLKQSRQRFLRKKLTQMTAYYNELLALLHEVLAYHTRYAHNKENLLIYFRPTHTPCIIYFNLETFDPTVSNHYLMSLFYFQERQQGVCQEYIECYYEVSSKALEGTKLGGHHTDVKLCEISLPNTLGRGLSRQVIEGVEYLIQATNKRYGRRYGKIKGCYLKLNAYEIGMQKHLGIDLAPLGYKTLGKITEEGNFMEDQILIHWYYNEE